jgi:hypothetical protein
VSKEQGGSGALHGGGRFQVRNSILAVLIALSPFVGVALLLLLVKTFPVGMLGLAILLVTGIVGFCIWGSARDAKRWLDARDHAKRG